MAKMVRFELISRLCLWLVLSVSLSYLLSAVCLVKVFQTRNQHGLALNFQCKEPVQVFCATFLYMILL